MIDLKPRPNCPDWSKATAYLSKADPRLAKLIKRVGPCTLCPRTDYFTALCQSIISQQISTKAAVTVSARFRAMFPRQKPKPDLALAITPEAWKSIGIGPQKQTYMRSLAQAFIDGHVPKRGGGGWDRCTDDEVIERLTQIRGIGRWTAEMFLMFVLVRPDILPIDDLGLQVAAGKLTGKNDRPKKKELIALAEPWRPFRTIATWYLWRAADSFPDPAATIQKSEKP